MSERFRCAGCRRELRVEELRELAYRCPCGHDQFVQPLRGQAEIERWAEVPGFEISSHLFVSWIRIAIEAARTSRDAALRLDPDREFGGSLVACTGSCFAIDAFYGDAKHNAGVTSSDRVEGTKRHQVVLDGLKTAFELGPTAAWCAQDLKWLYGLRDGAVHFKGGRKPPVRHHSGVMTSAEVSQWDFPAALRSIELLIRLLHACLVHPRDVGTVSLWAASVKDAFDGATLDWPAIRASWDGTL